MGPEFEGEEIDRNSLDRARWFIFSRRTPLKGEPFWSWLRDWMNYLDVTEGQRPPNSKIGIVTHNRNIQVLYAMGPDGFKYPVYDCDGPNFLSVHYYQDCHIAPWNGRNLPSGIYLIRHGETSWGT